MTQEPCGVESCVALSVGDDGFCAAHHGAKRAAFVVTGTHCPACSRTVECGDWITRESTMASMTHAACVPIRPSLGRKKHRAKPLLAEEGSNDAG